MINEKDVITIKIPYPNISSNLAVKSHMYICVNKNEIREYKFVKCQTLKPKMLIYSPITNYIDENPNININPFSKSTRIDCDKLFVSINVTYDDKLKTDIRQDISNSLFINIKNKLISYKEINLDENELKSLNKLIY